jgi:hypothetical protein
VHASHRADARQTPSGPQDDRAVDIFAQQGVRTADVILFRRCDCCRLHPKPGFAHGIGGVFDHLVLGSASILQADVEVLEVECDTDHLRDQDAQCLL